MAWLLQARQLRRNHLSPESLISLFVLHRGLVDCPIIYEIKQNCDASFMVSAFDDWMLPVRIVARAHLVNPVRQHGSLEWLYCTSGAFTSSGTVTNDGYPAPAETDFMSERSKPRLVIDDMVSCDSLGIVPRTLQCDQCTGSNAFQKVYHMGDWKGLSY